MLYLDLDNFPITAPYEKAIEEFNYTQDLRILGKKAFGELEQLSKFPLEKQQSHILIPCPKVAKVKNSTDMRLGVEVMKDLLTNPSIDVFIIGSADADYIPVIKDVQEKGKECIILTSNTNAMAASVTEIADQIIVCEGSANKPKRDKHSKQKINELLTKLFAKIKEDTVPISGINDYLNNNGYNFKAHGYVSFKQCMKTCMDASKFVVDFNDGTLTMKIRSSIATASS